MTILRIGDESVTIGRDYCCVETTDAELQEGIDMLLRLHRVKPVVNVVPWTARLIVGHFGGTIISEEPFNPNLGDVIHGITNITS